MKALIIGAGGFVGGYLIDELAQNLGWEVYGTKLPAETVSGGRAEICDLDILDEAAVSDCLSRIRPDIVYHLAAQSSATVSWRMPALTVDINIRGAVNVLEAVRQLDYKPRLVLIGSSEEYGRISEEECPISETHPAEPKNVYAITKLAQNMLGRLYADTYGTDVVMVRAFNHIGPRQLPQFVTSDFCKQVAEIEAGRREPVMYVGNLSAKRDFTDVRDIVRAYGLLGTKGRSGETYNVGSGRAQAVSSLLDMILGLSGAEIEVRVDAERMRPVDVPLLEADIRKLTADTGWKPEIPIRQTIGDILNYWRNNI